MINIAYVVHNLQAGGIERSVTRIVNRLNLDEFNPTIICLGESGPAEAWLERSVPIIEIGKKPGNDMLAVRRLSQLLRVNNIDILQSHNWGTLIESFVARKLARTPFHIHAERGTVLGTVDASGLRFRIRALAMSFALGSVNQVISNSHAVASRVQNRCGYRAEKIRIIPNGVPAIGMDNRDRVREDVRSQLGVPSDALLIGSVGRLAKVKGFEVAIRAVAGLISDHPNVHLVLVGDGLERENLEKLADDLGVARNIHLVGRKDNVDPWLVALDVYVNSSHSEGMSQSIIEAMAAGLPIVATDVGDTAQVLGPKDQRSGICIPAGNSETMRTALQQMAEKLDVREQFGLQSQHRHACLYSEAELVKNCEQLYYSVIAGSNGTKNWSPQIELTKGIGDK